MKRLIILAFLLSACTTMTPPATEPAAIMASPEVSPSPVHTPTVGYQATAQVAMTAAEGSRLEAVAAALEVGRMTQQADELDIERARITQQAEAQAAQLASNSMAATQQAAVFIPVTSTMEAMRATMEAARITQLAGEATQSVANTNAETYREFADELQATELILKIAVSIFIVGLGMLCMAGSVAQFLKVWNAPEPEEEEPLIVQMDTPQFRAVTPTQSRKIYYSIPCTKEQLIELADGICNHGMTLAVNQWEGKKVHPRMADNTLRLWAINNEYAELIPHKHGELRVTAAGEQFLLDTLAAGEPPAGYTTLEDE